MSSARDSTGSYRGTASPNFLEQLLLGEAILRDFQRSRRWIHRTQRLHEPRGLDRHVLELVRDHVGSLGQLGEPLVVVVGTHQGRRDPRRG